jgi:hypothetical protein
MRHEVQITNLDEDVYEVIAKYERVTNQGRQDHSYRIVVNPGQRPKYKCRKSQNTYIACSHILAACAARNYDPNEFTDRYYTVSALQYTWEGRFEVFGRTDDWSSYEGDKILPDRKVAKRERRKSKRLPITMNVLEGRMGPGHCESYGTINHTTDHCTQSNS